MARSPVRVEEIPTGGRRTFQLVAYNRWNEEVGFLDASKTKVGGRTAFQVDSIDVVESARRTGVATQLYEAAAKLACAKKARLASTDRLVDAHSNDFWEKQASKGRVEVFKPKTGPVSRGTLRYVLRSCGDFDLSGLGRAAPPKRMASPTEAAQRIAKRTGEVPAKLPVHIRPYAEFLRLRQGVPPSARDVIKAYAITRSSVQRGSVPRATLCKSYPEFRELARMSKRKDVRPEDVFAAWFFTPSGQAWLRSAEQGEFDAASARKIVAATSCWGLQNTLLDDLRYAVSLGRRTTEIRKALSSDSAQWIDYVRKNVKGVSLAKAGFFASLLGRGDIATFDARERKLWVGPKVPKTWDPRPADLERFRRRVRAFPLKLEPQHEPFREHLVHHALWDAFPERGGKPTKTTHGSVIRAMQFAGAGRRGRKR